MYGPPHNAFDILPGQKYYRITAPGFRTASRVHHAKVVNGMGGVLSRHGARYNYPGARAVYLTEDIDTALAEKMYYFQREILRVMDTLHLPTAIPLPPFQQKFVLWEIEFLAKIPNVFSLTPGTASGAGIYPALLTNPSQDYWHLKDGRAKIESAGYEGLKAPSSRSTLGGNIVVLFNDQSANIKTITPMDIEIRLVTPSGAPYINHVTNELHFLLGEFTYSISPPPPPASITWMPVDFRH